MGSNLEPLARFIADQQARQIDTRVVTIDPDANQALVLGGQLLDIEHELKKAAVVHPPKIKATTLAAVADYFANDLFDTDGVFVQIYGPPVVAILRAAHQCDGVRDFLLRSDYDAPEHHFDTWLRVPAFATWIGSAFVLNEAAQMILKTLDTGVRIEAARTARDDGISPEFKRSKGATGADWNDAIKGHLELQPRRTFPEVEQPVTLCSLRAEVRDDEDHPVRVKLVEADGGAWIPAATEAIAKWLKGKTGAAPILS